MSEHPLSHGPRLPLVVAFVIALLALGVMGWLGLRPALFGYLAALRFWLDASLGCLAVLMLHPLTGGKWGWSVRPALGAGVATIPVVAVAFIVVLASVRVVYAWDQHPVTDPDAIVHFRTAYLSPWFFITRALVIWGLWIVLGRVVLDRARRQGGDNDQAGALALARVSAPGLVVVLLSVTFAGDDWFGSLMPRRLGTIAGLYQLASQFVSAGALCILVVLVTQPWPRGKGQRGRAASAIAYSGSDAPQDRLNDLGTLLMTALVLLAYTALSRLLIIWSGDLPAEIGWYLGRVHGGWKPITVALGLTLVLVPIAMLLFRAVKQRRSLMMALAAMVLIARAVHSAWLVIPELDANQSLAMLAMLAALIAIGCPWWWVFTRTLAITPLPITTAAMIERGLRA